MVQGETTPAFVAKSAVAGDGRCSSTAVLQQEQSTVCVRLFSVMANRSDRDSLSLYAGEG